MHCGILCSPRYKYIFLKLTPPISLSTTRVKSVDFVLFYLLCQKHNKLTKYAFIKNVIQLYKIAFN